MVKLVILYQFPFFRIVHDTICLKRGGGVSGEQSEHKWHRHIIDYQQFELYDIYSKIQKIVYLHIDFDFTLLLTHVLYMLLIASKHLSLI